MRMIMKFNESEIAEALLDYVLKKGSKLRLSGGENVNAISLSFSFSPPDRPNQGTLSATVDFEAES